ncbi:hypothetical protein PVAG01_04450 [Phlyctema vagabunda]|uniref:3'-5' exonuclease domain-containing protein n=1 Tax=Phlyctema vagabunda TaxID=108571 RepID=A0ABR4PPE3_9HELO
MSEISAQNNAIFIDSETNLLPLLDSITNLPVDPPSLYIDLKGINLGRHGSVSIFALHIASKQTTYLIDVHTLGKNAFSATNEGGTSLRAVLESPTIPKVVFDIRNASDALFSLFQVSVDGIRELQLMELACRPELAGRTGCWEFVSSLAQCIAKDSSMSAAGKMQWHRNRGLAYQLSTPEKDGGDRIFNERPLRPEVVQYCTQNVQFLPDLFSVYNRQLRRGGQAFWRVRVRESTRDRIKLSQSLSYDGSSKSHARGWSDEVIEELTELWNEDLEMEDMIGENVWGENDEWVPAPIIDDFDDSLFGEEEEEVDDDDYYQDTARDCIGWEEDMVKNGEYF